MRKILNDHPIEIEFSCCVILLSWKFQSSIKLWGDSSHEVLAIFCCSLNWINLVEQQEVSLWWRTLTQLHGSLLEGQISACWGGQQTGKGLSTCQHEDYFKLMKLKGAIDQCRLSSRILQNFQNEQRFRLFLHSKWKVLDFSKLCCLFFHRVSRGVVKFYTKSRRCGKKMNPLDYLLLKMLKLEGNSVSHSISKSWVENLLFEIEGASKTWFAKFLQKFGQ